MRHPRRSKGPPPKKPKNNRDTHDPDTLLPPALLAEFNDEPPQERAGRNGPPRKVLRKRKRRQKKRDAAQANERWRARRAAAHGHENSGDGDDQPAKRVRLGSTDTKEDTEKNETNEKARTRQGEGKRTGEEKKNTITINNEKKKSLPQNKNEAAKDRGKSSLSAARSRKKTIQEKPVQPVQPNDDPDAREVRRLEKLLGIDKKRKRKGASKTSDGLEGLFSGFDDEMADLMDFCEKKSQGKEKRPQASNARDIRMHTDENEEEDLLQDESEEEGINSDEDNYSGSDEMEAENSDAGNNFSLAGDDATNPENGLNDNSEVVSDGGDTTKGVAVDIESSDDDSSFSTEHETVLPRSSTDNRREEPVLARKAHDSTPTTAEEPDSPPSTGKYVPPSARRRGKASSGMLARRLRGLLNRVADTNAQGVADSLISLFREQGQSLSRREQAQLYSDAGLDSSRDGSGIGQVNPYIQSHAAIASHLGRNIDSVFLASVVSDAIRRIAKVLHHEPQPSAAGEEIEESDHREAFGYTAMLCALHAKRAVSSHLIYELVKFVADPLTGDRLELLLFLLRQAGPILRMDDPSGLKDVVIFIRDKTNELKTKTEGQAKKTYSDAKLQIMLELVTDIKNNKVRKSALRENQARFEWADVPDVPLSADLSDLLDDDFVSVRWWDETKGLSVAERRGLDRNSSKDQPEENAAEGPAGDEGPDLGLLASSLRLNTDLRKAIFKSIMGSVNVSDAIERLEMLGALASGKKGKERDVAVVLLLCCCSERAYNPFYALLAEKLSRRFRSFRFSLEYTLWDTFKTVAPSAKTPPMPGRKRRILTRFLTFLWAGMSLSLSVLRGCGDFDECPSELQSFFADAVAHLVTQLAAMEKSDDSQGPFKKLRAESWVGVDDFRVSLSLFLRREVTPHLTKQERITLSRGLTELERKGKA